MENSMYFDQCMDFLARMIEKYGDKIEFPKDADRIQKEDNDNQRKAA